MAPSPLVEALRRLATDHTKRSKTAQLRDVLPEVERASSAGVPRSEIVKVLALNGLNLTEKSMGVMLSRIRKKQAAEVKPLIPSWKSPEKLAAEQNTPVVHSNKDNTLVAQSPDKSYDPASLKEVMRSKPNLDHYARIHRETKAKE